ncbi:DegQ family serine endoprotease [Marinobacterium mangrovicola]|uniref:Probable periplasmic serine endoprotease DegP-like n=1 Tax=Marinobacterium mangrovicola TaxID=1476959 RepID=A0A4R1G904_9GAMM|nr:DegQ family serine endoprotease [Marinobacterium mangrovicola]TCK03161.1 serine protease Do [Marinobacterium mangrovicola]
MYAKTKIRHLGFLMLAWVAIVLAPTASAASLPDFTELVEDSAPAVVNISTVQAERPQDAGAFGGRDMDEIPEMFRHFFRNLPEFNSQPRRAPESLGSGFIISDDGYILTNNHVVKGAEKILVRLNDRRELEAEVVGADARSDVALLKIAAQDLPVVKIGKTRDLKVGEWVLAIGSPFGFDHTVTAGIVSAKERALANESYVPFIQTDVAINPGNSGGPLFNLDGEVVGINSQIYTRSGGFMGLSFAIPIDVAMDVADQLKQQGHVSRGWLGVIIQEVNRDLAESFGLAKPAGALVAKVLPDSPAQAAGVLEGDVITSFDGRPIALSSDLPHMVGRVKPGSEVEMTVIRGGEKETLNVVVGLLPEGEPDLGIETAPEPASMDLLGLTVEPLTDAHREKWNVRSGVIVVSVTEGAGANAGVVAGDVITMLNGKQIQTVDQFSEVVADLPADRSVPMRIVRRGSPLFIPLKLSE